MKTILHKKIHEKGISQREAAELLDLPSDGFRKHLARRTFPMPCLDHLEKFFGLTSDDLRKDGFRLSKAKGVGKIVDSRNKEEVMHIVRSIGQSKLSTITIDELLYLTKMQRSIPVPMTEDLVNQLIVHYRGLQ